MTIFRLCPAFEHWLLFLRAHVLPWLPTLNCSCDTGLYQCGPGPTTPHSSSLLGFCSFCGGGPQAEYDCVASLKQLFQSQHQPWLLEGSWSLTEPTVSFSLLMSFLHISGGSCSTHSSPVTSALCKNCKDQESYHLFMSGLLVLRSLPDISELSHG